MPHHRVNPLVPHLSTVRVTLSLLRHSVQVSFLTHLPLISFHFSARKTPIVNGFCQRRTKSRFLQDFSLSSTLFLPPVMDKIVCGWVILSWICCFVGISNYDLVGHWSVQAFAQKTNLLHLSRYSRTTCFDRQSDITTPEESDETNDLDMETFQARKKQQEDTKRKESNIKEEEEFDGYALRDVIYEKWGKCYDVDFNRVDSFGFRCLYLNVLPFHLGGQRFRHESEMDYLYHLQAVVEILEKYDQIGYVLAQIDETRKKPRAGTSPLVAVPLRLDLSRDQVNEIIGY
jgi:hypothetical protein